MELDDLKARWQSENDKYSQLNQKSMEQLQLILKGKTSNLVFSLKKNFEKILLSLFLGMLASTLIFPLISDGFTYPGSINGFLKLTIFYLVVIIFYWIRFKNINDLELADDIRERMLQLITLFNKNKRIEVFFVLTLYVVAIGMGRFIYGKGLEDLDDKGFLVSIPLSVLFTGVVVYLIISKYKKRIKELQEYLKEFNENQ